MSDMADHRNFVDGAVFACITIIANHVGSLDIESIKDVVRNIGPNDFLNGVGRRRSGIWEEEEHFTLDELVNIASEVQKEKGA